ncbi:MAG: peptide chain release factor N(5)-glutamine methyltransferase [Planctomycetaceae bacterium]|nr:peptide chain release factor N(5)-glutamine methyltransferase [Planctomycetaceae bacterium]
MSAEPWTVGRLLQWTADYLKSHGSDSPRLDAEVLLAHALGCQRIELYTTFDETPGDQERTTFRDLVRRRAEGAPVAYLVGSREFYSLRFKVTPDVLIPRPETELLVVTALDLAKGTGEGGSGNRDEEGAGGPGGGDENAEDSAQRRIGGSAAIADVGTGSGILAICLAKHLPDCRVTATDVSRAALAVAKQNAETHGVAERIEFIECDLLASVPGDRQFDLIVSNPPYIAEWEVEQLARDVREFEPRGALVAGPRGTEIIERLVPQAAERLRAGGRLLMEISPTIDEAVRGLVASDSRFDLGPTIKDLARLPRVIQARKK